MGSFSIWHWLIVLVVVALVFGTKKLRNLGGDLGDAVKGFKDAVNEGKDESPLPLSPAEQQTVNNEQKQSSNRAI